MDGTGNEVGLVVLVNRVRWSAESAEEICKVCFGFGFIPPTPTDNDNIK